MQSPLAPPLAAPLVEHADAIVHNTVTTAIAPLLQRLEALLGESSRP